MDSDKIPKPSLWLFIILALFGFAAAVTYLGKESRELAKALPSVTDGAQKQARVYTVYYDFGVFSPTNIRIHAGDSIKFQNDSRLPVRVVSDSTDGVIDLIGFDSIGDIPSGGIFSFTFSKEGIFGYYNFRNPAEEGSVIVRP
ncbi:MAG: hypothetical protein HY506_02115 [Candidatus Yanofskybacteria bacterium]|nr:hypothetical protein [Candidatus Yanofskybacteria bacterium]